MCIVAVIPAAGIGHVTIAINIRCRSRYARAILARVANRARVVQISAWRSVLKRLCHAPRYLRVTDARGALAIQMTAVKLRERIAFAHAIAAAAVRCADIVVVAAVFVLNRHRNARVLLLVADRRGAGERIKPLAFHWIADAIAAEAPISIGAEPVVVAVRVVRLRNRAAFARTRVAFTGCALR